MVAAQELLLQRFWLVNLPITDFKYSHFWTPFSHACLLKACLFKVMSLVLNCGLIKYDKPSSLVRTSYLTAHSFACGLCSA